MYLKNKFLKLKIENNIGSPPARHDLINGQLTNVHLLKGEIEIVQTRKMLKT